MLVNLRRLLAALLLAASGLALGTTSSHADECVPQMTQENAKSAKAIFTGVVTSATNEPIPGAQRGALYTHEVEVGLVYKGDVTTNTVQVVTQRSPDTCSLGQLAVDTTYVFFVRPDATTDGGAWVATGGGGTAPASDKLVAQVERLPGEGHPPVPPEPETAAFTLVSAGDPATLTRAAAPGLALIIIGLLGLIVVGRLSSRR